MKTLIPAAIRCSLMFTGVPALSLAYPASVQAVPTTYQYTGNPCTFATGPYTTSMFVTAMVTLAGPLGVNMPLTEVHPIAFTLSDGVQTITNTDAIDFSLFEFTTDAFGHIAAWRVDAYLAPFTGITSDDDPFTFPPFDIDPPPVANLAQATSAPGYGSADLSCRTRESTLLLLTLTLMALGLVAGRFQRAAA